MLEPTHQIHLTSLPDIILFAGSELRRLTRMKLLGRQHSIEAGADFLSLLQRGSSLLYARQSELWGLKFWANGPNSSAWMDKFGGDL